MTNLITSRRFMPLFVTQFCGALNDNLLKNALVMLVTYRIATEDHAQTQIVVTLAAGLFILPYFLFSALCGQIADKYNRATLTRLIKIAELVIMPFAALGFYLNNIVILLVALFLMGIHSTFFGPIKYALLPQHLHDDELISANAYIEAGTFLAILIGTIAGGLLILQPQGETLISLALFVVAIAGYTSSRFIPTAPPPDCTLKINYNIFQESWNIIQHSRKNHKVFICILAISWFWLIGATFLSQFPSYAKDILKSDETVVTLFLTVFSIGIAAGSLLCNRLLKGQIKLTYTPFAALGITLFSIDLFFASQIMPHAESGVLLDVGKFITQAAGIRIVADLLFISICAGIYIVPLYAVMQHDSEPAHRARISPLIM